MANENSPLKPDHGQASPPNSLPGIAAAFLVKFDHRKGYVIAWHEAIEGVQVEGTVEFKSLPSGLHNVRQDLVYFVQDRYAGISAFINHPDEDKERNANMLAVGVLVPLEHGRVGKGWLHAEELEALARQNKLEGSKSALQTPRPPEMSSDNLSLPKHRDGANGHADGYKNLRAMSTGSDFPQGTHSLTPHHPATKLMDTLQLFGPLIFLLYRAALLRKRILFVTEAPVELACNIVYNLSVVSSFPRSLLPYISGQHSAGRGSRPLFNVGIMDIPALSSEDGWIACTTDDVLASKPELYDVVVFLPNEDAQHAAKKQYPKILLSSPELMKSFPKHGIRSTQRDAVRYLSLMRGLKRYPPSAVANPKPVQIPMAQEGTTDDTASILSTSTIASRKEVVESASWSQVAYTSLLWWASAGARRDGLSEDDEDDRDRDEMLLSSDDENVTKEVAVVGYFRRLTGLVVSVLSQLTQDEDDTAGSEEEDENTSEIGTGSVVVEDEETGEEHQHLLPEASQQSQDDQTEITPEDMMSMALDVWSASDRKFVEEFAQLYWQRQAKVRGGRVECCGVRIL
ncbi:uncharacterized protein HMPREF1541_02183 [Cyphellophora europaea CBS 101466]|uniref:DUF4484 domain-containing protein n=1 Tax=Cyphellophora europaea (strain CBS 101466) TaxID=1220924 RepID=W2S346_CYPE1|nr:uncharacterized protein HMPREF1541_02183 [Cyphellophora europaea CBS 101466]ETN43025.1 hypothetical protein HMPREF1541_02183 [Cyphellophora europaea CBS 101466]